jgi:hypothetical protein
MFRKSFSPCEYFHVVQGEYWVCPVMPDCEALHYPGETIIFPATEYGQGYVEEYHGLALIGEPTFVVGYAAWGVFPTSSDPHIYGIAATPEQAIENADYHLLRAKFYEENLPIPSIEEGVFELLECGNYTKSPKFDALVVKYGWGIKPAVEGLYAEIVTSKKDAILALTTLLGKGIEGLKREERI